MATVELQFVVSVTIETGVPNEYVPTTEGTKAIEDQLGFAIISRKGQLSEALDGARIQNVLATFETAIQ